MTTKREGRPRRRAIPQHIKNKALSRTNHHCDECKTLFIEGEAIDFDHRPPLWMREVNADRTDYVPPQLHPAYIDPLHRECHHKRTFGRTPGATKTVTIKGSDKWLKTKFDRLEGRTKPKRKQNIPSRPFPKKKP